MGPSSRPAFGAHLVHIWCAFGGLPAPPPPARIWRVFDWRLVNRFATLEDFLVSNLQTLRRVATQAGTTGDSHFRYK